MSVPFFSRLTKEKIDKMQTYNEKNFGILKTALRKSYVENDQLRSENGNVSYLICIFKFVPFHFAFLNLKTVF